MKPTEHLEHIIALLGKATPAEIKGSLLAMQEQLEADERTVAEAVDLREKYAALQKAQPKKTGEACPFCGEMTFRLIEIKPHLHLGPAGGRYGHYKCDSCGKTDEKEMP